jgi:hypothetical protein
MPELLWKAFIDFEIDQQEYDRARKLYTKLLRKTQHVKVRGIGFTNEDSIFIYKKKTGLA